MPVNFLILQRKICCIQADLNETKVYCVQSKTVVKLCCFLNLRIF